MKIAIASESGDENGEIGFRGGRTPFYLILEDNKLVEKWKNPFATGGGGAGFSVAYALAEKKVDKVIAGKIGPNMQAALKEKNISFEETTGKISEVLK